MPSRHGFGIQTIRRGIDRTKLKVTRGKVKRYGDGVTHEAHCAKCGSLLYSVVREGSYAHVTYGTQIDPPSLAPTAHIFAGSKAPWYSILDGLPQHAGFPPK